MLWTMPQRRWRRRRKSSDRQGLCEWVGGSSLCIASNIFGCTVMYGISPVFVRSSASKCSLVGGLPNVFGCICRASYRAKVRLFIVGKLGACVNQGTLLMSGALLAAFVKGAFPFLFIYRFVNEKKPLAKPCEHCKL